VIINHAFVDGKKRAAYFICDTFLRINGWKLAVESRNWEDMKFRSEEEELPRIEAFSDQDK